MTYNNNRLHIIGINKESKPSKYIVLLNNNAKINAFQLNKKSCDV